MLTVQQLLTPLTRDQFKAKCYELAAAVGLPTTNWLSGAPTRTLIAIVSEIYGAFIAPIIVAIAASGFLDDAEESWLTLIALSVYNVTRREATFATGEVTLDNAGGGIYPFEIGEAVFINSTTEQAYTNTEAFTLGSLEVGKVVAVRALTLGTAGNATVGQIDTLGTTMPNVTVTNAADLVGQDAESDPDLRQRCRDSLGATSPNGPAAAYRYVALTPPYNGGANINRVKVQDAEGDGTVTVTIASPTGAPTAPDVVLVQAGLDEWATPDTVIATAVAANEEPYTIVATVHVNSKSKLTTPEWDELIKDTLVTWVRALPIDGLELDPGDRLIPYRTVEGVIERVRPATDSPYWVLHAELVPETDFTLPLNSVATIETTDITLTIVQVDQQ